MEEKKKLLILGLGNYLMGDEGLGVHAARELDKIKWPDGVEVLDGGTGGFHLMGHFENYERLIIVDATLDGEAGRIRVLKPKFSKEFPKALSTHDIGMKDLIESLILRGTLPEIDLVAVSIEKVQPMTTRLSPEVRKMLPEIIDTVINLSEEE